MSDATTKLNLKAMSEGILFTANYRGNHLHCKMQKEHFECTRDILPSVTHSSHEYNNKNVI